MGDETLRERAARETAEGVARMCWDEPLLRAFGVKLHADTVSVELTPEQARVASKLDEIFEDEAQAIRSLELEKMRRPRASCRCGHCHDLDLPEPEPFI